MRKTNSNEVDRDWGWADGYLDHAKEIIGKHLIVAAPMKIDCEEASDLIYLVSGRGDVAFRVRRPRYRNAFPFDITFRWRRDGFSKTELDKIFEGRARFMLYGFGDEDGHTLARWVLIDLEAFRATMLRGQIQRGQHIENGDGTAFEKFDVRILRGIDAAIILASNFEIPNQITPAPKRETASEYWARKERERNSA